MCSLEEMSCGFLSPAMVAIMISRTQQLILIFKNAKVAVSGQCDTSVESVNLMIQIPSLPLARGLFKAIEEGLGWEQGRATSLFY